MVPARPCPEDSFAMSASPCVSRTRRLVIYGSFVLALAGWVVSAWAWLTMGVPAGVHPVFIMALSVGIAFTATLAVTIVLPDKARMFSLGFQEGVKFATEHTADPEPRGRHLSVAP